MGVDHEEIHLSDQQRCRTRHQTATRPYLVASLLTCGNDFALRPDDDPGSALSR